MAGLEWFILLALMPASRGMLVACGFACKNARLSQVTQHAFDRQTGECSSKFAAFHLDLRRHAHHMVENESSAGACRLRTREPRPATAIPLIHSGNNHVRSQSTPSTRLFWLLHNLHSSSLAHGSGSPRPPIPALPSACQTTAPASSRSSAPTGDSSTACDYGYGRANATTVAWHR